MKIYFSLQIYSEKILLLLLLEHTRIIEKGFSIYTKLKCPIILKTNSNYRLPPVDTKKSSPSPQILICVQKGNFSIVVVDIIYQENFIIVDIESSKSIKSHKSC